MLIRALVTLFCLVLVSFAYVARKPLCVDTNSIYRADIAEDNNAATMFKCGVHRHVPYDDRLTKLAPLISSRIKVIENFFAWAGPLKNPINLTQTDNRKSLFRVYDHDVFIGKDLIENKGFFERAIMKVWLRERANRTIIERSLLEEVFTDFFLSVASGTIDGNDPGVKGKTTDNLTKWPLVLRTMNGYCASPWKFAEHIQFCQQSQTQAQDGTAQLTIASIRPMLSHAMIGALKRMNTEHQFQLVQKMAQMLNIFYFKEPSGNRTLIDQQERSYQLAANFVVGFAQALSNWKADDYILVNFAQNFLSELELRGFSDFGESSTVQFYVLGEAVNSKVVDDLQKYVETKGDASVIVEQGNDLFMLPNAEPVPKTTFGYIRSKRAIWLRCQMPPTPDEVLRMANRFDRILAVDICDKSAVLDLKSYVSGGPSEFAKRNREVAFVHINTKSFSLAMERKENPYGWTKLYFVKAIHAYKAENVIPSIDYFRGRTGASN